MRQLKLSNQGILILAVVLLIGRSFLGFAAN